MSAIDKEVAKERVKQIIRSVSEVKVPDGIFEDSPEGAWKLASLLIAMAETLHLEYSEEEAAWMNQWRAVHLAVLRRMRSDFVWGKGETLAEFVTAIFKLLTITSKEFLKIAWNEFVILNRRENWKPSVFRRTAFYLGTICSEFWVAAANSGPKKNAQLWRELSLLRGHGPNTLAYIKGQPTVILGTTALDDTELARRFDQADRTWEADRAVLGGMKKQPNMERPKSAPSSPVPAMAVKSAPRVVRGPLECWYCRGPHSIYKCPTVSDSERARILAEKRPDRRQKVAIAALVDAGFSVSVNDGDSEYYALMDSGDKAISLVHPRVAEKLQAKIASTVRILAVDGVVSAINRTVDLSLTKNGLLLGSGTFYILDSCPFDVIVSKKMLGEWGAKMDLAKDEISFPVGKFVFERNKRSSEEEPVQVVLEEDVTIVKGTRTLGVKVKRRNPWMFEPNLGLKGPGAELVWMDSAGHRGDEELRISMHNNGNVPLVLRKGERIGSIVQINKGVECLASAEWKTSKAESLNRQGFLKQFPTLDDQPDAGVRKQLEDLLWEFKAVFNQELLTAGEARFDPVKLELKEGAQPTRSYPYPNSKEENALELQYLEEMVKACVLQKGASDWASPFLLVKKKGTERLRPVVNYARLNSQLKYRVYALPRVQDVFAGMHGKDTFSVLDITSGFWNLPLHPDSWHLTGISTHHGSFFFRVLPMGLHLSPSVFEEKMEECLGDISNHKILKETPKELHPAVLKSLLGEVVKNLIDDCAIPTAGPDLGILNLRHVLERLRLFNLKVKPTKCALILPAVKLLGHVASKDGLKTDPDKIKRMLEWPEPTSKEEVKRITQMFAWYRPFIWDFAKLVGPMNELCKKGVKWEWTEKHSQLYRLLKQRMTEAPVLAWVNWDAAFELITDASGYAVGSVLGQRDNQGVFHPIAFHSYWLSDQQRRWGATDRELLAVRKGARANRAFLRHRQGKLTVDHEPLEGLIKKGPLPTQSQRRQGLLEDITQEFNLDVHVVKGKSPEFKALGDTFSRPPGGHQSVADERNQREKTEKDPEAKARTASEMAELVLREATMDEEESLSAVATAVSDLVSRKEIEVEQRKDDWIGPLIEFVKDKDKGIPKSISKKLNSLFVAEAAQSVWLNGKLWRYERVVGKRKDLKKEERSQLWLPEAMVADVLTEYHDSLLGGGHTSADKLFGRVREVYYCIGLHARCVEWHKNCAVCPQFNAYRFTKNAPLQPMPAVVRFNQRLGMDLVGPMVESALGNRWILHMVEYLSKKHKLVALPNALAETVARGFVDNWITQETCPEQIVTDRGANFLSEVLVEVNALMQSEKLNTAPYRPQTDGLVERANGTMGNMLAKYVSANQLDWDTKLPMVEMNMNLMPDQANKLSPFEVATGRQPRLPIDLELRKGAPEDAGAIPVPKTEYVKSLKESLQKAKEFVKANSEIARGKMKQRYDANIRPAKYKEGDLVYLWTPTHKIGLTAKLEKKWSGPMKILEVKNNGANLKLQRPDGTEWKTLVNVARVKPFWGKAVESEPYRSLEDEDLQAEDREQIEKEATMEHEEEQSGEEVAAMVDEWTKREKEQGQVAVKRRLEDNSKEQRTLRKKLEAERRKEVKNKAAREDFGRRFSVMQAELIQVEEILKKAKQDDVPAVKELLTHWMDTAKEWIGGPARHAKFLTRLSKDGTIPRLRQTAQDVFYAVAKKALERREKMGHKPEPGQPKIIANQGDISQPAEARKPRRLIAVFKPKSRIRIISPKQ